MGKLEAAGSNNSSPEKKIHAGAGRKPSPVGMWVSIGGATSPPLFGGVGVFFFVITN
jgi:hypothetical protein